MITIEEFIARRKKLCQQLKPNSVLILTAATIKTRNADNNYYYRQDSNFWYFTAMPEANSKVAIYIDDNKAVTSYIFAASNKDAKTIAFEGKCLGPKQAALDLGFDMGFEIEQYKHKITSLLAKAKYIYTLPEAKNDFSQHDLLWSDLTPLIAKLRLIKSPAEIKMLTQAANISSDAHISMMQRTRPGLFEYQLEANFLFECYNQGARDLAYSPIVAAGKNGCTLHYHQNSDRLNPEDLILIDAGAEYNYYAADITRTYPISGKFNNLQKDIYSLVLAAQQAAIEIIKPGVAWDEIQAAILKVLIPGMQELKLVKGSVEQILCEKSYTKYYMHSSGHWLGLDVHDIGSYTNDSGTVRLEPGMVFTIEPGLYLSAATGSPYHNLAVRIEDDILVTPDGYHNLTGKVPKQISELEQIIGS